MSDSVSRPPTFTEAMNELVPEYRADEPWYLKAADIGSIVPRLLVGGARSALDVIDRSMWSGNLLTDPHQQQELARTIIPAGLGLSFAPLRPPGSLGVFGGIKAATANMADLVAARGLPDTMRDLAWERYGWGKGEGGQWMHEIDDSGAILNPKFVNASGNMYLPNNVARLEDILHHPDLYAAYPSLKDTMIRYTSAADQAKKVRGSYWPDTGDIELTPGRSAADTLSTLLHEIQHKVAHIEGFPRGGAPEEFFPAGFTIQKYTDAIDRVQPYVDKLRAGNMQPKAVQDALERADMGAHSQADLSLIAQARQHLGPKDLGDFQDHYREFRTLRDAYDSAIEDYRFLSGEVQSRTVQERQKYTPEERRGQAPWNTPGYPTGKQGVKYYNPATPTYPHDWLTPNRIPMP